MPEPAHDDTHLIPDTQPTPDASQDTTARPGWHIAVLLLIPLVVVIALDLLHVPELLRGLIMK